MNRTADALPALLERGWISVGGPGLIRCTGPFVALCSYFDAAFAALAWRRGAQFHAYPGVVSRQLLERLEYFSSFPGVATDAGECYVLPPAVCYQTYEHLADRELVHHPYRVTVAGRCSRFEGSRLTGSPECLWNFTMRELIFFGSDAEVAGERKALMRSVTGLLRKVGMTGTLAPATDPFFLGESRGKLLLQKLKELKLELRTEIRVGVDMAIASFNHHEDFFTRRMNIRLAGGGRAHSGCAAFGIERWSFAFVCQNGLDIETWPEPVRRFVARHEAC
jgi:seryl-tRNA synthetase